MLAVRGKKIYLGLSGGVDSAVSAALLKKEGALVTGVFIKGWYPPDMPCTWGSDRRDAMRVAAHLHIPFLTLDVSVTYKESVIDYLVREYRAGRTPNPDVMCNRDIKFGVFHQFAQESGAHAIATGHYRSGEKDQRYFLWAVPKSILEAAIFPVGDMDKSHVRLLARHFKLPVAEKKDSQGVCFLGSISIEEFLKDEFGEAPGRAFDEQGTLIGEHNGVLLHTLGERVALHNARESGPWFVLAKDIMKNEMTVGKVRVPTATGARQEIRFTNANWFTEPARSTEAQYRYRGPRVQGYMKDDFFVVTSPCKDTPAPGQSIVFYCDSELCGGGIITA